MQGQGYGDRAVNNEEIIEQEIAELEGQKLDYATAQKLSWLYIVRDHMSAQAVSVTISRESAFMQAVDGKDSDKVWHLLDELMAALQALKPNLYESTLRKLREI